MTKSVKQHSKGYFYVISVSDTDDVFYQIYHGGRLSFWFYKMFGGSPKYPKSPISGVSTTWYPIRKRTHLPATVGATYLEIDKVIEGHKATLEHGDYAKGILAAKPDGLKMIEGLEKLEEGDPEGDAPYLVTATSIPHNASFNVSGSGMFYTPPV